MKVILFKSTSEDASGLADKFQTALTSSDIVGVQIHPQIVPVLDFNFCNISALKDKLTLHEIYEGIIFTSPRCVSSVQQAITSHSHSESEALVQKWCSKYMFCVGKSTAQCAATLFPNATRIVTSLGENSESLGHKILEMLSPSQESCVLYPCGNLKRDTLQSILNTGKVLTDPLVVYETIQNPTLQSAIEKLSVEDSSPFVFFSPSGLHFTLPYAKHLILQSDRPLIALGPTTKDALLQVEGIGGKNVFQCESPSPEGLIQCLKLLCNSVKPQ